MYARISHLNSVFLAYGAVYREDENDFNISYPFFEPGQEKEKVEEQKEEL